MNQKIRAGVHTGTLITIFLCSIIVCGWYYFFASYYIRMGQGSTRALIDQISTAVRSLEMQQKKSSQSQDTLQEKSLVLFEKELFDLCQKHMLIVERYLPGAVNQEELITENHCMIQLGSEHSANLLSFLDDLWSQSYPLALESFELRFEKQAGYSLQLSAVLIAKK